MFALLSTQGFNIYGLASQLIHTNDQRVSMCIYKKGRVGVFGCFLVHMQSGVIQQTSGFGWFIDFVICGNSLTSGYVDGCEEEDTHAYTNQERESMMKLRRKIKQGIEM